MLRLSDRKNFGVVAVQSQAGAENAMGGVAQALADNVPILVLLGGLSTSQVGTAARPCLPAARTWRRSRQP